jgi:hypothetical protein
MPPSAFLAPPLRILDPEEADERAHNRQTWSDFWQAIARESGTDQSDEPCNDEEVPADSAA